MSVQSAIQMRPLVCQTAFPPAEVLAVTKANGATHAISMIAIPGQAMLATHSSKNINELLDNPEKVDERHHEDVLHRRFRSIIPKLGGIIYEEVFPYPYKFEYPRMEGRHLVTAEFNHPRVIATDLAIDLMPILCKLAESEEERVVCVDFGHYSATECCQLCKRISNSYWASLPEEHLIWQFTIPAGRSLQQFLSREAHIGF